MKTILFQPQAVFIFGFLFGFITVFLSKYADYIFESPAFHKDSSNAIIPQNYETWLRKQNIQISKVDLDAFIYGTHLDENIRSEKVILEAEWLKKKVLVTCVVFVEKLKLAATIKDTWGKHCNRLLFFSQRLEDLNLSVINLGIKYTSSWQLLCEVMTFIWKRSNEIPLNWLMFVKDDTIIIPENLRYMLAPLDFREPHYLGHAVALWGVSYNVAQAGYVLSFEVIRRLMEKFNTPKKCAAGGKYWKKEDYYLGKHLASLGVHPSDTRDAGLRGTFHGFPLNTLLWRAAKPDNYFSKALYPPGPECCSSRTVTFSIGDPDKMRSISYMLYQLRVFYNGIYGNIPASTPYPENEVWRSALREEFNLTVIENISSDRYFQIWRRKYSEPEQFIEKNFRKMSVILNSIIDNYESQTKALNESLT